MFSIAFIIIGLAIFAYMFVLLRQIQRNLIRNSELQRDDMIEWQRHLYAFRTIALHEWETNSEKVNTLTTGLDTLATFLKENSIEQLTVLHETLVMMREYNDVQKQTYTAVLSMPKGIIDKVESTFSLLATNTDEAFEKSINSLIAPISGEFTSLRELLCQCTQELSKKVDKELLEMSKLPEQFQKVLENISELYYMLRDLGSLPSDIIKMDNGIYNEMAAMFKAQHDFILQLADQESTNTKELDEWLSKLYPALVKLVETLKQDVDNKDIRLKEIKGGILALHEEMGKWRTGELVVFSNVANGTSISELAASLIEASTMMKTTVSKRKESNSTLRRRLTEKQEAGITYLAEVSEIVASLESPISNSERLALLDRFTDLSLAHFQLLNRDGNYPTPYIYRSPSLKVNTPLDLNIRMDKTKSLPIPTHHSEAHTPTRGVSD